MFDSGWPVTRALWTRNQQPGLARQGAARDNPIAMCGIAGFVNREGEAANREIIERMTATLSHRGPDGSGIFVDRNVALGHRRLSIIDVGGGAQPLSNEDDSIWITYNGELYNELPLRRGLEARGHTYRTGTDTETLVHLYEEQGTLLPRALNGMFAFAIWDSRRGRLFLTRDRMGQKPLYYAELDGGGFVFGSEPKALLRHPAVSRELDLDSLERYLFYEYLPAPHTIWRSMRKLPAGHSLVWENGRVRIDRYWTAAEPQPAAEPFEPTAIHFWSEFRDAVGRHRRSDVPLGVFLSGGIDSSSVAAAVCEIESARNVRTFSIGFDDPSFDESPHARAVARHLGTQHHERQFSIESVQELLPEVATWLDEPFGDASVLPTYLLSQFAREEVTVILGGDGADELLAGYPTFRAESAARLFRRMPRAARELAAMAVRQLPVNHRNFSLDFKLKQFVKGAGETPALAHQRWLGSFSGAEIAVLLQSGSHLIDVEAEHVARATALPASADALTRSLWLYQDTYLPDDILTKVDRASMACGLEVRAPFLDTALVQTMQALPSAFKARGNESKRILKQAALPKLPPSIIKRPKKGFGIPVGRWLRGPLQPLLCNLLDHDRLIRQGLFNADEVERRVQEHLSGFCDHRKPLWTLLMFQLWHETWIGN
jgi:asparagine synthase (glutamine-hydrolysing)